MRDSCVLPGAGAHEIFTAHRLEEEACRIERELAAADDPNAEYDAVDPDAPRGVKGANVYGLRALAAALLAVVEATARNSGCRLERCMIDPSAYSAEGCFPAPATARCGRCLRRNCLRMVRMMLARVMRVVRVVRGR